MKQMHGEEAWLTKDRKKWCSCATRAQYRIE